MHGTDREPHKNTLRLMPTKESVNEFVLVALKQQVPQATLSMTIRDLNIDSLELLDLILSAEEHFLLEIDAEGIDPDMTIDKLCEKIRQSRPA
jgi:acyl carrier protein